LFEIISIIKSKLPNTKILFISILNRYDKTKTKNKISSNDILLEEIKFTNDLMKSNPDIEYFDLSQYIYEEKYFNEDKLHLNEDGYNLFAEKLIEHINKHYLI
jgi:lysophospholipase L1-like esterase